MSFKIRLFSLLALCAIVLSFCGCAVNLPPPENLSSNDEAMRMGFSAINHDGEIPKGGYEYLSVEIKADYKSEVQWSSSDPEVATVDSMGRVDGIKEGKAVITAKVKSAYVNYDVVITEAAKTPLTYSTAYTSNAEYVSANRANGDDKNLYAIIVNEHDCSATVFTYNAKGEYSKPVRAMVCSTSKSPLVVQKEDAEVERVDVTVTEKAQWIEHTDGNFYRYATYLGDNLMICSTPYSSEDPGSLKVEDYNKLGTRNSNKNIWFSVADAKWIYDNCKEGTVVNIVNSSNTKRFTPLEVPQSMKLTENSKSLKFDPTDDTQGNPYIKLRPQISGAEPVSIRRGSSIDLYKGLTAVDTCGNDITAYIQVEGNIDVNKVGSYLVSCYATDDMGRTTRVDREIIVTK